MTEPRQLDVGWSEAGLVALTLLVWIAARSAPALARWATTSGFWPLAGVPVAGMLVLLCTSRHIRRRRAGAAALLVLAAVVRSLLAEQAYRPLTPADYVGPVELLAGLEPSLFGPWGEARLDDGSRVLLSLGPGMAIDPGAGAGSRLMVEGRVDQIDPSGWARSRHLRGRLTVTAITADLGRRWWMQPSSWFRSLVAAGADHLGPDRRALYTGLVIGDDRQQSPAQQATFRAAGLSHLLAVSGQNVAFVLAAAAPLGRRLGWRSRWLLALVVLAVFAIATELEPSVLRASAMAALAVTATALGWSMRGARLATVTVVLLILIDPMLTWSVGFTLSVAAVVGILALAPVVDARLPGPVELGRWWRLPASVTVSAQIAVTPFLVFWFGPVSLVALPANVLAGWAAGLVMTWGATVGLVAGLLPPPVAAWIQWPASLLLGWIEYSALTLLRVPAPVIDATTPTMMLLAGAVLVWSASPRLASSVRRALLGSLLLLGAWLPVRPGDVPGVMVSDARGGRVVVIERTLSTGDVDDLLDNAIRQRWRRIDTLVLLSGGRRESDLVAALGTLLELDSVLAPRLHRVVGGTRVIEPVVLPLESGWLLIEPDGDRRLRATTSDAEP